MEFNTVQEMENVTKHYSGMIKIVESAVNRNQDSRNKHSSAISEDLCFVELFHTIYLTLLVPNRKLVMLLN